MVIVPRGNPVFENLNSYYLDLRRLLEHYQGEMDAQIPVTSRDEIGDLAEAIGRMQESIRLSIERLRRRR